MGSYLIKPLLPKFFELYFPDTEDQEFLESTEYLGSLIHIIKISFKEAVPIYSSTQCLEVLASLES